jgi:hypothetical protein
MDTDDGKRGFEDYATAGVDAFLRFSSRAGDAIRVSSNRAIEKIDLGRLEKRLSRLYETLGRAVYLPMSEGLSPDLQDAELSALLGDIAKTAGEIERRKSAERLSR